MEAQHSTHNQFHGHNSNMILQSHPITQTDTAVSSGPVKGQNRSKQETTTMTGFSMEACFCHGVKKM